jgi:hypothetical protein
MVMLYYDARYSRFQVLTEGRPAWARDDQGSVIHFDGLRFWKPTRRGRNRIVASWQSPSYGWEHESECSCRLCGLRRGQRDEVA